MTTNSPNWWSPFSTDSTGGATTMKHAYKRCHPDDPDAVRLFVAYNGFLGAGPVGCLIMAADQHDARMKATHAYGIDPNPRCSDAEKHEWNQVEEVMEVQLPYIGDSL